MISDSGVISRVALFYINNTTEKEKEMNGMKDSRPPLVCTQANSCSSGILPAPSQFAIDRFGVIDGGHILAYCPACKKVVPADIKGNCLWHKNSK